MSVQLAIANIALETSLVSRQGFGTLLFVGKHNYFSERVRTYSSTKAMLDDGIPSESGIYVAAQGAFSQEVTPTSIKIGRQETTSVLSPVTPTNGLEYKVTIAAKDAVTAEFTYTAVVPTDDEEAVVDALKILIDADTDIAAVVTTTKVGTGTDATLQLSQTISGTDWFTVSLLTNLTESFLETSTETAADTIAAIQTEDDAWYYFHAEDKTNAFILAAAADLEAKLKVYRTSVDESTALNAPSTGTPADLLTAGYFRTQCFYHHEAKTKFPEVNATAEIASYVTGAVAYHGRTQRGVSPSLNASGNDLSTTQQTNLEAVNCDFFARAGRFADDPVITVVGQVAGGEWLDNIVGRDNMQVDLEADLTNLLISQKASKVAFNNKGANQLRSVVSTVLTNYTFDGTHNFIEDDFKIIIPDQEDFNPADKASRTFRQLTFTATLTNAIKMAVITGTLSL